MHNHPIVKADPEWCSCCRKSIISGLHNVVRINKQPEKVLNLKGEVMGVEGREEPKAFYHAECFQNYHLPTSAKRVIECKYCGVFSQAKKLKDGSLNSCKCSCHDQAQFCSLLILNGKV